MNRIGIIESLLAAGVETKEAMTLVIDHMNDKAQFFDKLHKAQQNLGRIIKDTRDQRGRNYAGVDQFVGKAQRAFNEAGLTMLEHNTGVVTRSIDTFSHTVNEKIGKDETQKETKACRTWEIDCILADTTTGFSMPLHYEVPINPLAWDKEPEKAVGSSDSYGLKYLTRGVLFAERSEHDPDRTDDPDHKGYDNAAPKKTASKAPPSVAPSKKKSPKKATTAQRKKAARDRMAVARAKVGNDVYNSVLETNPMGNIDEMEAAADVLDARMRLDALSIKAVTQFGQPEVDGWLELYRPLVTQQNIADAIAVLADELNNSKGKGKGK